MTMTMAAAATATRAVAPSSAAAAARARRALLRPRPFPRTTASPASSGAAVSPPGSRPSRAIGPRAISRRTYVRASSSRLNVLSSFPDRRSSPSSLRDLDARVSELERACDASGPSARPTLTEVRERMVPLMAECAAAPHAAPARNARGGGDEHWERAELCRRLLELCLRGAEGRREFLWEWLEEGDSGDGRSPGESFSPSAYWDGAPHPTSEMYSLVFSAYRNAIESRRSFSARSVDAMELMEASANRASALLSAMEDESASDASFVDAYNARMDRGRYAPLRSGACGPDVKDYGAVIGIWGDCIDGSASRLPERRGRRRRHDAGLNDRAFQGRIRLEATAMKSMMKLLESMEEDLYETFGPPDVSAHKGDRGRAKCPPPDRVCYNVILAAMARQVNPSLYEMRLVIQRMLERVKFELEWAEEEEEGGDLEGGPGDVDVEERAMVFFPDVYSYNALIEARANRSAAFALDWSATGQRGVVEPLRPRRQAAWEQGCERGKQSAARAISSGEEEAFLAEQVLVEMTNVMTVRVTPNVWSYNSVMKAWIKSGSDRGLRRAVLILRCLALNRQNEARSRGEDTEHTAASQDGEERTDSATPTVMGRITQWGASLMGRGDAGSPDERIVGRGDQNPPSVIGPRGPASSERLIEPKKIVNKGHKPPVELWEESDADTRPQRAGPLGANRESPSEGRLVMPGRMALLSSVLQGNAAKGKVAASKSEQIKNAQLESLESIRPLPNVEPRVTPDPKSFIIVINALEQRGTAASAAEAEDLLRLLEKYYLELSPDIGIYNSVLNAWSRAAKEASNLQLCLTSAQRAEDLLRRLLGRDQEELGSHPLPNESSFLMSINAWANAASVAASSGKISEGVNAANHVEKLLDELEKLSPKRSKTTLACYGAAIRVWASLSHAEKAQLVLEKMTAVSGGMRLELIPFNAVLDASARELASSTDPDKVLSRLSNIRDLLVRMNSEGGYECFNIDPDTSSFNHAIRACYAPWSSSKSVGNESTRHKALGIAHECYSMMCHDYNSPHRPDSHTYAHMFKAIACLLPSIGVERDAHSKKYVFLKPMFQACCRDGHLAKSLLWTVRKMLSEDEFLDLLSSQMGHHGETSKEKLMSIPEDRLLLQLPQDWSRHGRTVQSLNRHPG
ncbi:hypothetical protein ACHAWF_008831 [Thalassiosira exigua]